MNIERPLITYQHERKEVTHHILTLHSDNTIILMSAVNLFLKEKAYKSIKTSERYSSAIKRFLEFIIKKNEQASLNFWREVQEGDIREWQGSIVQKRDQSHKQKPSDKTIYTEACIVFDFYCWARKCGFPTLINESATEWKFNYRDESRLLTSKNILSGSNPGYANIDTGNKRSRNADSNKKVTIMSTENIKQLSCSYSDPVYSVMFLLALATGMREQGVCSVPYIGYGANDHIRPYPEIKKTIPKDSKGEIPKTFDFTVVEKGSKIRTLKVNMAAWKVVCITYMPLYYERRKLFEKKHPDKNANAFFFLNKAGNPVTPKMVADRTYTAKQNFEHFDWSFHSSRDWYATMFIIKHLSRERIDASHYDAAIEEALRKQLGHSDIRTTYMSYVRTASILLATQSGELDFSLGKDDDFWGDITKGTTNG